VSIVKVEIDRVARREFDTTLISATQGSRSSASGAFVRVFIMTRVDSPSGEAARNGSVAVCGLPVLNRWIQTASEQATGEREAPRKRRKRDPLAV